MNTCRFFPSIVLLISTVASLASPLDTWTNRTSKATGWLKGVVYGNNQFVAVGEQGPDPSDNAVIVASLDGINWTDRSPGTAPYAARIVYGNERYVAVGSSGTVLTSPDSITWTSSTSSPDDDLNDVTYGNHQFVAVGFDYRNGVGAVLSSPDGITWSPH